MEPDVWFLTQMLDDYDYVFTILLIKMHDSM